MRCLPPLLLQKRESEEIKEDAGAAKRTDILHKGSGALMGKVTKERGGSKKSDDNRTKTDNE